LPVRHVVTDALGGVGAVENLGDDRRVAVRLELETPADDGVWPWYGSRKPNLERAESWATFMAESWRWHGVHKWIAYDRVSGGVVGLAGLAFASDVLGGASRGVVHGPSQRAFARRNGPHQTGCSEHR
jgi:hypothetical protein